MTSASRCFHAAQVLLRPLVELGLRLFHFIPERAAYAVAPLLGRAIRLGRKQEVLRRYLLFMGDSAETRQQLKPFWRAHVAHLGRSCFEPQFLTLSTDERLLEIVALEGAGHLQEALQQKRGAVLFINHLGSPGAIVAGFGMRGYDITMAGNRLVAGIGGEVVRLDHLEEIVQRMFRRGRVKRALLGEGLPQRIAEVLGRNGLFAMFIDFPVVKKHNQMSRFGAAQMKVNLGPAILALRYGAPVLSVSCLRVGANRHRLIIKPPLALPDHFADTGSRASDLMQRALDEMAVDLRSHPDQWWPWDWAEMEPVNEGGTP